VYALTETSPASDPPASSRADVWACLSMLCVAPLHQVKPADWRKVADEGRAWWWCVEGGAAWTRGTDRFAERMAGQPQSRKGKTRSDLGAEAMCP
jgi:hypothetical protein